MKGGPKERRGFMRSACRHCIALSGLGLVVPALSQTAESHDASPLPARFARPPLDTDEGGLWAMMDREEAKLRRSSFAVRDATLGAYLQQLACRLAGNHCADLRVHIVRSPHFNATMAPNGMMQVWTGLLLRVENEAQLAAVLGHEIGHYIERHTVERLRDLKSRAAFGQFMAMFGLVGVIAQIGVLASAFAFSREQETRADQIGMRLMQRAGFDGAQAAAVWDNLLGELKIRGGEEVGTRSLMLATHPPAANRRDELLRLAGSQRGSTGSEEFELAIAPHRFHWLQDEVRRGQWDESLVLFDRMLARRPDDAQVLFARGEVFRLREGEGDAARALADLSRATSQDRPPAEAFRALGLTHKRQSDAPAAVQAFEKYLLLSPEAGDAGLIKTYLTELKP